jgi:hypothetical protein
MARIDDYQQARDLAAHTLAQENLQDIGHRSGFTIQKGDKIIAPYLDRTYLISFPQFEFIDALSYETPVPLQEQVLLLHYLKGCQPRLQGQWIAYREIPGAGFYYGAFVKRAIAPLKKVFGQNVAALKQAAAQLNAITIEPGSAGFRLDVLPYAPLQIIVWQGDEEFPPEANILFDATVGDYLSPEDVAWLASLSVYRLMALAHPT